MRRGGFGPRAAVLRRDYRFAVFTAMAALVREHEEGQADGSETGQARTPAACFAAGAVLTDTALTLAPPSGHEEPQVEGSQTAVFAASLTAWLGVECDG